MSKTKNAMQAPALSMTDAQKALILDTDEAQEQTLYRKWYRPVEHGAPIVGIILGRSQNVRDLFPSELNQANEPLYAYAIELRGYIPRESGSLMALNEPVEGLPGEVVYMFEPRALGELMRKAMRLGLPFAAHPQEKRRVQSKRFKRTVEAWNWTAKLFPKPVKPVTPPEAFTLPNPEEASSVGLLPAALEDISDLVESTDQG